MGYLSQWLGLLGVYVVVAASLAWFIEGQVTRLVLDQVMTRAVDQVELGLMPRVTSADFEPPFTADKIDDLGARLEPVLDRVRQQSSGVIRVNLFARDGTVLYSDLASLRGQVVSPLSDELLGAALGGTANAASTVLSGPEDADLGPRYGSALEAYVPCILGGRVVGVYEFYSDLGAIRPIRTVVWSSTAVGFAVLLLGVLAFERRRGRLGRAAAPLQVGPKASVALAMGAVRLLPAAEAGAEEAPAERLGERLEPALPALTAGPKPVVAECWLTRREMEVLRLLATDRTYRQIAHELFLSEETVRSHVKHILRKLEEPSRSHAVAAAVRAGLLPS